VARPDIVGHELAVRLSIEDPEPGPGYDSHYHFDNVRCVVSNEQGLAKSAPKGREGKP